MGYPDEGDHRFSPGTSPIITKACLTFEEGQTRFKIGKQNSPYSLFVICPVVHPLASVKQLPLPKLPADRQWLVQGVSVVKQPMTRTLKQQNPYLWGLGLGSFTLSLVNGALVISAGISWVAYQQFLTLTPAQWQQLKQQLQRNLPLPRSPRQQALVLSGLVGGSTYTLTALWHSTQSLLVAVVLTGQSAVTLFILAMVLRSPKAAGQTAARSLQPPSADPMEQLEQRLAQLSHGDPVQRLGAIRQLVRLGELAEQGYGAGVSVRSHLIDCLQLMLTHEPEPIVRGAAREGLARLRQAPQLPEGPAPLPSPPATETAATETAAQPRQSQRTTVEYIEYQDA